MKKQTYIYIIGAIFFLILIGIKQCQLNKERDKNQIANVQLSALNDSVAQYKSQNGDLTAKIISVTVESDNRKKALEEAGFELKELRARDIKWRDAVFALKAQIQAQGNGQTTLRDTLIISKTDTLKRANFDWNNRFLFLSGSITGKDMQFKYAYKTSIDLLSEKKGKSYVVSAYLSDPQATITTANSITIVPEKKWWGWDVLKVGAGFGLGVFIAK
jgi:hypothetical protein